MPRISEFHGIAIYMYYHDHLPPHFHAFYAGREAEVDIGSGALTVGSLPRRARGLVRMWAVGRRAELLDNWGRATTGRKLSRIAPLE